MNFRGSMLKKFPEIPGVNSAGNPGCQIQKDKYLNLYPQHGGYKSFLGKTILGFKTQKNFKEKVFKSHEYTHYAKKAHIKETINLSTI